MNVSNIRTAGVWTSQAAGKTRRGTGQKGITFPDDMAARAAEEAKNAVKGQKSDTKSSQKESETDTQIIVKPDGSRVLMMTMNMGGIKTVTSMEISKPTDMINTIGLGTDSDEEKDQAVEEEQSAADGQAAEEIQGAALAAGALSGIMMSQAEGK